MIENEAATCRLCEAPIPDGSETKPWGSRGLVHKECLRSYQRDLYRRRQEKKGVKQRTGPIEGIKGQICIRCEEDKEWEEFYKNASYTCGYEPFCKKCRLDRRKALWHENIGGHREKDQIRKSERTYEEHSDEALYQLERRLASRYKMTMEEYTSRLREQKGLCAICGNPEVQMHYLNDNPNRLAIDHDHKCCKGLTTCGKCVRGLLCRSCNTTLGRIEEVGIEKFVFYLTSHYKRT